MSDRTRIKPSNIRLVDLIDDIKNGLIKVPVFQRDFVWEVTQMLDLFDSIVRGFPIGSILLWNPEANYETKSKIGPHEIISISTKRLYVLDGYQRISTLFGTLYRPVSNNTVNYKDFDLYYDLLNKEFIKLKIKKPEAIYLPLYKILDPFKLIEHYQNIINQFPKEEANNLIENAKVVRDIQ